MNTTTPTRTPAGEQLAKEALTKALIYFRDGNSRKRYSRDKVRGLPNRKVGITRLKNMVAKFGNSVQKAIIYDNVTDLEITRFQDGKWQ